VTEGCRDDRWVAEFVDAALAELRDEVGALAQLLAEPWNYKGPDGLVQREHAVGVPGLGALKPQSAQILGLVRLSRPWSVTAGC
jgi:hypothetical protein